jgi:hypothetical protein
MKSFLKYTFALLLSLGLACAQNTASGPVTKDPQTNRIKEDLKIGAGRTLTVESGGALSVAAGSGTIDAGDIKSGTLNKSRLPALTKADVGLTDVDNTSDASKPVSAAVQSALAGRANVPGLIFTGSGRATATISEIGTLPFMVRLKLDVRTTNPTTAEGYVTISTNGSHDNANGLCVFRDSLGGLNVRLAAATSNYRTLNFSSWATRFGGTFVDLHIYRTAAGTLELVANNQVLTCTDTTSGGTPPAWSGTIAGTVLDFGSLGSSGYTFTGKMIPALLLGDLTTADRSDLFLNDRWPTWARPYQLGGSPARAELTTNGALSSSSGWNIGTAWSVSGGVATCAGGTDSGDITEIGQLMAQKKGMRIRITYTVVSISTGTVRIYIYGANQLTTARSTAGTYTEEITLAADSTKWITSRAGGANPVLDDVTITVLGLTTDLSDDGPSRGVWANCSGNGYHTTYGTGVLEAGTRKVPSSSESTIDSQTTVREYANVLVKDLCIRMPAGTPYTAGQVLASIQGPAYSKFGGLWRVRGMRGDVLKFASGFAIGVTNVELAGTGFPSLAGINAEVVCVANDPYTKIEVRAKLAGTMGSTNDVDVVLVGGSLMPSQVK